MSKNRTKFKWYRFNVARRIRILEGDELVKVLDDVINDIKTKKLDKNGLFEIFVRQLEALKAETKFVPKQKSRQFDPFYIPRSGDGRIVLFGLSNVGKSTLMNAITNTDVKTGNYLHTTQTALAGTCEYKNVKIQIIDVPGFLEFKEEWAISSQIVRVARTCDAILLVIDLTLDVQKQLNFLLEQLKEANLLEGDTSIYKIGIIATKGDLPNSKQNFELLRSLTNYPIHPTAVNNKNSLIQLKEYLFSVLEVMRIFTKPPRKEANLNDPFICPQGTTVGELAEKIHKDFFKHFRYARIWGNSVNFPGQRVGLEHELQESDVVEITIVHR